MSAKNSISAAFLPALLAAGVLCGGAQAAETYDAQQSVPPGLLACTHESDALLRLTCFDREIKRLSERSAAAPSPAHASPPRAPDAPDAPVPAASPKPPPIPVSAPPPPVPQQSKQASPTQSASALRHIRAHIERVDVDRDDFLILHLDNRQTWKQEREAPAELHIRAGDAVAIDRELGQYYLSDRLGVTVRVRQVEP